MRLIGLNGRRESGKDTAFAAIKTFAEENDQTAKRAAFADGLKLSGMRSLGFKGLTDQQMLELADLIKETGRIRISWEEPSRFTDEVHRFEQEIYGRHMWQEYGTAGHRSENLGHSFGENFWIDNLLPLKGWEKTFTNIHGPAPEYCVVTDVRFPNEAQRILDLGGEVIEIAADIRIKKGRDNHPSEQPLPSNLITAVIDNNGSLDDLARNVRNYFRA